jgi:rubrerythrin
MKPEVIIKLKEQFKAETMAFAGYEMIIEHIDDEYLEDALEEIMYDEYLHAKFLRSYMIDRGIYEPSQHPDCEKAYMKMLER